jgi:hypothetical protein
MLSTQKDKIRVLVFIAKEKRSDHRQTSSVRGDQADFTPRLKKPVLMVNGRYDYVHRLQRHYGKNL